MTTLSERDLVAHLRAELRAEPEARAFAFRTTDRSWAPEAVEVDGESFRVVRAVSELALRAALVSRDGGERIAILTDLEDRDVGLDVLARLARRRLLRLDPWETVRAAFQAQTVEPRLRSLAALGGALLKAAPASGYRPVPTGTLDAETAWRAYEHHVLGLDVADNLTDLFRWLLDDPKGADRLLDAPNELREGILRRWEQRGLQVDALHRALLRARDAGSPVDAIVVGLALGTARRGKEAGAAEAERFTIRLEEFFGVGKPPTAAELQHYASSAESALAATWDELEPSLRGTLVERLDTLLVNKADPELHSFARIGALSRTSALRDLATAVVRVVSGEVSQDVAVAALDRFVARDDVDADDPIAEHATDLVRLAARHRVATSEVKSLAAGAEAFASEWSFEDALRERVSSWDGGTELREATRAVVTAWLEVSEARNAPFAARFAEQTQSPDGATDVLWCWDFIGAVVAPLAKTRNVLVVVLDGLNWAVARSLLAAPSSWDAWVPGKGGAMRPMLTIVPSVTEYSRTSLLCGTPRSGNASDEAREFPLAIERAAGRGCPSKLFHKGVLEGDGRGRVSDEVVHAVEDDKLRVVGIVVNAIDDQLSGAEQMRVRWSTSDIAPLRTLLDLASATERLVVLVGDHGHVWETRTEKAVAGRSARWRDGSDAADGEVTISGPFTKELVGVDSVVAAWSEKIRYGQGRRGYHGGASMQEVVVPCIVLDESEQQLGEADFVRCATSPPAWWRFAEDPKLGAEQRTKGAQANLLDIVEGGWVEQLLAASVFADRRRRFAGNDQQFPEVARTVLRLLGVAQGSVNVQAVARQLGRNVGVTVRYISTLGDVLNVDGSKLLSLDRMDGMVRLDAGGVKRQFGVEPDWS